MSETTSTLTFDLSRVTAGEMAAFFRAVRENDVAGMARVFALTATACPYGDPGDAQTYLDLPFFGAFQDVIQGFNDAGKKLNRR